MSKRRGIPEPRSGPHGRPQTRRTRTMGLNEAFALAIKRLGAGQAAQAEEVFRRILRSAPGHAGSVHYLGMAAFQQGRLDEAVSLVRRSIKLRPNEAGYRKNLAMIHRAAGRTAEAVAEYRRVVQIDPASAEAWLYIGNALAAERKYEQARAVFERVVELMPDQPGAHVNLANALSKEGRLAEAEDAYRSALRIDPSHTDALNGLGSTIHCLGRIGEAIETFERTLELDPKKAGALSNLGLAMIDLGRFEEAVERTRRAVELCPDNAGHRSSLAAALRRQGRIEEAVAEARRAVELEPDLPEAGMVLGYALADQGRPDEAVTAASKAVDAAPARAELYSNLGSMLLAADRPEEAAAAYEAALALDNRDAGTHFGLSMALLTLGRFREGWAQYEWRGLSESCRPKRRLLPEPLWDGRDLGGRRILLHCEQGYGDVILASRYLPLVVRRRGRVTLECHDLLFRLLGRLGGIEEVIQLGSPLPICDFQCPLMSLPKVFDSDFDTIPHDVPYLSAAPAAVQSWSQRLGERRRPRVGLVWACNQRSENGHRRSMPLEWWAPILAVEGVDFCSLQVGAGSEQLAQLPAGEVADLSGHLTDFAETAAAIYNLDLVISVDTAVVHLAGALAKPVWVLLPFAADWRWFRERSDSPWYPTARLFRQEAPGDWSLVAQYAAAALREWAAQRPPTPDASGPHA